MLLKKYVLLFLSLLTLVVTAQTSINQFDVKGERHGVWKKKYNNGNVRYTGKFEHGKEVGSFKFFAVTGEKHPIVIKEYNNQNNIIEVSFYSSKGVLESEGQMNGKKRVGKWTYQFLDGKTIMSTEHYINGLLDGEVKIFYKSGKLTEVSHYKAGKLDGNLVRYSDEEKETENLTYINGVMHGPAIIYDEKGEVYARGSYENGMKTGVWEFNMDGEMVKTEPEKIKGKKQWYKVFIQNNFIFNMIADENVTDAQMDSKIIILKEVGINRVFRVYRNDTIDYKDNLTWYGLLKSY